MRILLVDDHALFRDGVALLLKELDPAVQTVHAAHLGEALAALDHDTGIDLVLLDLILPGANGFQALETIRERHPGMPLVMLSSQEDQVTVLRAIQLGARLNLSSSGVRTPAGANKRLTRVNVPSSHSSGRRCQM